MVKLIATFYFVLISINAFSCIDDTTTMCGTNDLIKNQLFGNVKSVQVERSLTWHYEIAKKKIDTVQTETYMDFFDTEGYKIDRTYDGSKPIGQTKIAFNDDSSSMERIFIYATDTSRIIHFYKNCRIVQCQSSGINIFYEYDQNGILIRKSVLGEFEDTLRTFKYSYSSGNIVKIEQFSQSDELVLATYYQYDNQNRVTQMRIESHDSIELANENYNYSRSGLIEGTKSFLGNKVIGITKYKFDKRGNWIRSITKDRLYGNRLVVSRIIKYY